MTPEALAEIQGHTEVIRVMRAWETLHPSEPYAASDGGMSETPEVGSTSVRDSAVSDDGYYGYGQGYDGGLQQPSRKGKERAFSFSSAKSELSVPAVKMKNSIEGFFRRSSRSNSITNSAEPSSPNTPLRISTFSDGSTGTGTNSADFETGSPGLHSPFFSSAPPSPLPDMTHDHLTLALPGRGHEHELYQEGDGGEGSGTPLTRVTSGDSTILAPPNPPFRASSPSSNRSGGSSTVLAMARSSRSVSRTQDTIDETASNASDPSEYEPALETIEQEESEGTDPSRRSVDSSSRPGTAALDTAAAGQDTDGQVEESPTSPTLHIHHTLPPRHTFSSRRPSLPSILEKAAHPGQAFRNAMRRDRHASESTPTIPEDPSQPKQGTFLRGRKTETSPPHRRFGTIKGFFRRGNSPPSRSPSPPKKNAILPDELDERLRRASLDMSQSEGSSADNRDEITVPPMPHSAPATKTRFFEDLSEDNSDLRMAALASLSPRIPSAPMPRSAPPVRKTSGGVMISSPLANEVRDQPDTDNRSLASSMNNPNFRRSKTEVVRSGSSSPRLSSLPAFAPVHTKRRSATLPSQARVPGFEWDETASLRRAAASEVIRRNSEKLRQAVEEAEARTEDGESVNFVDAEVGADGDATPQDHGRRSQEQEEQDTPHVSDGEHDEDEGDLTPEATPAGEKSKSELELGAAVATITAAEGVGGGASDSTRHRGASIGSFMTDSTRLSTPSVSTIPHMSMSIASYDTGGSERYHPANRSPTFAPDKLVQLRAPPNSIIESGTGRNDAGQSRSRGNTVSSLSVSVSESSTSGTGTGTSGMRSSSQGLPSGSTPPTSMTPPSALGPSNNNQTFPPVPEHDDDNGEGSSPSLHPHPQQQQQAALTREEAAKLVKQNELDILQLAQLPQSLDSSKSLAAQLAAYGENHQLEQQIAAEERRAKRRAARSSAAGSRDKGKGKVKNSSTETEEGEDGTESFVSATSGEEDVHSRSSSSVRTTGSSALRMTTLKHDKGGSRLLSACSVFGADAGSSRDVPSRSTYDKHAGAQQHLRPTRSGLPRETAGVDVCPGFAARRTPYWTRAFTSSSLLVSVNFNICLCLCSSPP